MPLIHFSFEFLTKSTFKFGKFTLEKHVPEDDDSRLKI